MLPILATVLAILATGFFPIESQASLAIIPALIAAGAAIGSAVIGANAKASAEERAAAQEAQALKQWMDINIPSIEEQEIYLKQLRSAGQLSPALEQSIQQQESKMNGIETDPRLKEAQLQALTGMQDVVDSGGMTLTDQANMEKVRGENAAAERGSREAIMQNMRNRGVSGSGLELAAQLDNQQASAERNHAAGLSTEAAARDRALQAMISGGEFAGEMQGREFGQKAEVAKANDAINRFNTSNSQDVLQRNTAAKNAASQYNLTNDQRIADTNVGLQNQQEITNKGLYQTSYQNKLDKTAGATKQYNTNAGSERKSGADAAAMWGGIGQSLLSAGTTLSQEQAKKKKPAQEEEF